jgi:hypothetical protein
MDTSIRREREKRELCSLRTKTREICPTASTRKNAEAPRNKAFRERKRGTEKICPPCVVAKTNMKNRPQGLRVPA